MKMSFIARGVVVSAIAVPMAAVQAAGITVGNVELATDPGNLIVDGGVAYPMTAVSVDPQTGNVTITTADQSFNDGTVEDPPAEDPPAEDPPAEDPPAGGGGDGVVGSCEQWVPSRELVQASGDGRVDLDDEIKSFAFEARQSVHTNQASYTTTNQTTKTVWVSLCPGGEPLNRLIAEGYQSATVRYSGGAEENPPYLIEGKTYYFNVMNAQADAPDVTTCQASNCPAVIRFY